MDLFIEILKWVAIVFVAGVIGQFGKSLTLKLLAARRGGRSAAGPRVDASPPGAEPSRIDGPVALSDAERKLRKKQAKAEYKRAKKEGGKGA